MFFLVPDYVKQTKQVKIRKHLFPFKFRQIRSLGKPLQRRILFRRFHTVPYLCNIPERPASVERSR